MDPTADVLRAVSAETARRLAELADGSTDHSWPSLLSVPGADADGESLPVPEAGRLAELAGAAGLDPLDLSLLLAAITPSLDARFGPLFAGVDAARPSDPARMPSAAVLFAVNGCTPWDPDVRARLGPLGRLRRAELITLVAGAGPLPTWAVAVPERVVAHLLGDPAATAELVPLAARTTRLESDHVVEVARALQAGWWNVWIHDAAGGGLSVGASALDVLGAPAVTLDLERLPPGSSLADVLPAALREAVLTGGGVVVGPVDPRRDAASIASLPTDPVRPLVMVSAHGWNPAACAAVPVVVGPVRIEPAERVALWSAALDAAEIDVAGAAEELAALRLGPERIFPAAVAGVGAALVADEPVGIGHLRAAALAHGTSRLVNLARWVQPRATFDDLVVDTDLLGELRSVPGRHATRHIVRDEWGLSRSGGRGSGLTCLFAGPSGTGKTLAAEVIANALGVDLFIIDLSQIVDKYIGETEKNLERVFQEAEGVNGVLLFDEADALFGKRSDVKSSHDRHANVEVAYLLQRMERYDGIAVLTTNLRGNIDEAFSRRLDVVCNFAEPGVDERRELWRLHLPPSLPQQPDVDIGLLAEHLQVSGGVIRNITLTAAHVAAVAGRAVGMDDLVVASVREYRKMGRLFKVSALSPWLGGADVASDVG